MLQTQHGGASARPFVTHSNAFDTELFLRIAPELFLKRAVVGGTGLRDQPELPERGRRLVALAEFAMVEAYQAYGNYEQMADLTQELVQNAAKAVTGGSLVVTLADGSEYDLGGEWARMDMYGSLSEAAGREITPETPLSELVALAEAEGVEVAHATHGKYVEELWEHFHGDDLHAPTFVMNFPVDTSPLTREHRTRPGVVEKWDLYVRGFELATAYSELVDPVVQRERFVEQAKLAAGGDPRRCASTRTSCAHSSTPCRRRVAWAWGSTACSWRSPASASARRSCSRW